MSVFGWIETIERTYTVVQRLEAKMAGLQNSIDAVKSAVADEAADLAELNTDVKSVSDELTKLRAELASGGVTQEQLDTLDAQAKALQEAHVGYQAVHQGLQSAVGGTGGGTGGAVQPGQPGA
jgi:capsule polysaccharide export protein KpsE/RkpR